MLGGTLPGCKQIAWSWSEAGGRPLRITWNTMVWLLITFEKSIGAKDIDVWTSDEHNYAITPCYPFFRKFAMLLELITLEAFPWIPLGSFTFPSREDLKKRSWNLKAIMPNDCNHWTPKTTLAHPFGLQSWDYRTNNPHIQLNIMALPWTIYGTSIYNQYLKFWC